MTIKSMRSFVSSASQQLPRDNEEDVDDEPNRQSSSAKTASVRFLDEQPEAVTAVRQEIHRINKNVQLWNLDKFQELFYFKFQSWS